MSASLLPRLPDAAYSAVGSEVYRGLTARPKTLSPWLFYDAEGSRLFEAITELPEYYLTRTEREILEQHAEEIVARAADGHELTILELGAGTATKTGLLLQAATAMQGRLTYHALDVSETALDEARSRLEADIPELTVRSHVTDYTDDMSAIAAANGRENDRRLVLYIGSSIGNFEPDDALQLLRQVRGNLVPGDCLLLGTDMVKFPARLRAAYDDAAGVTADFNRNVLVRINRELDADFHAELFRHKALWNSRQSRIEMHLESLIAQEVSIAALELRVRFTRGETIHTENSYKFTNDRVVELLERSGFGLKQQWRDHHGWFGVHLAAAK